MSYASEIESKAIYVNALSYRKKVGRLVIEAICENDSYNRIGTEVRTRYADSNDWIFRSYLDGTAYFYPGKLSIFNWTTERKIKYVIEKHYRTVQEVIEDDDYCSLCRY